MSKLQRLASIEQSLNKIQAIFSRATIDKQGRVVMTSRDIELIRNDKLYKSLTKRVRK